MFIRLIRKIRLTISSLYRLFGADEGFTNHDEAVGNLVDDWQDEIELFADKHDKLQMGGAISSAGAPVAALASEKGVASVVATGGASLAVLVAEKGGALVIASNLLSANTSSVQESSANG